MANVNIKFNGKEFLLSCDDGQEAHLEELSEQLNKKFENLKFIKEHKEILNSDYLKGLTCKWNFELIKNLPEEHISWDYLGIGAFYQSKTKEEAEILKTDDKSYPLEISTKPLVAIGGINKNNMDEVFSLGYETIALSDGIFFQEDLKKIIKNLNF